MENIGQYMQEIEEQGWTVEAPVQRVSDTAKFYFVRHGMSMYNYRSFKCEKAHGKQSPEFQANMVDVTLCDPDLHPIGVAQAEANAPKVNCLNVKYVMVSPMQRAMQTCIHMFKNHPNKANISFIVEPMVHEIMHTTNDFHMDALLMIQKYAPGQAACHGIEFDFSRITGVEKPQLWCAETICVPATKATFYQKLSEKEGGATYANVKSVFLEMMLAELPHGAFETKADIYQRGQVVKQLCRDFLASHPLQGDEKIAVVCHSQLIASLTADGFSGEGAASVLTNFTWTLNAEVLPVDF